MMWATIEMVITARKETAALKDRVRQLETDLRRLLVLDIPKLPPETKVSPLSGWLFLNKDNQDITDRGK